MPRNTAVFGPTFAGEGTVRSDDITKDPRYGQSAPYHGMPEGHLPVRSYLAVPWSRARARFWGACSSATRSPVCSTSAPSVWSPASPPRPRSRSTMPGSTAPARTEIAERRQAEAALRESEGRFRDHGRQRAGHDLGHRSGRRVHLPRAPLVRVQRPDRGDRPPASAGSTWCHPDDRERMRATFASGACQLEHRCRASRATGCARADGRLPLGASIRRLTALRRPARDFHTAVCGSSARDRPSARRSKDEREPAGPALAI